MKIKPSAVAKSKDVFKIKDKRIGKKSQLKVTRKLDSLTHTPGLTKSLVSGSDDESQGLDESYVSMKIVNQPKSKPRDPFKVPAKISKVKAKAVQKGATLKRQVSDTAKSGLKTVNKVQDEIKDDLSKAKNSLNKTCQMSKKKMSKTISNLSVKSEKSFPPGINSENDPNVGNSTEQSGSLLRKGIKFGSQESFMRFIQMKPKQKSNKRKLSETEEVGEDNLAFETSVMEGLSSPITSSANKHDTKLSDGSLDESSVKTSSQKCATSKPISGLNKKKLLQALSADQPDAKPAPAEVPEPAGKRKKSVIDQAKEKLITSRFRFLNEKLYSQPSSASVAMFTKDRSLFDVYHQGYAIQSAAWPLDPLDNIIAACLHLPEEAVVADMGCGEARLARSITNTVHSFDLVAGAPGVVACDMSSVPLASQSVDVVVFCLSLMGTNVRDFLVEAGRILKPGGMLKVAELESRFQQGGGVDQFIKDVEKYGFSLNWKDLEKQYFFFMDFTKSAEKKSKKKLPQIELKPCLYKRR